VSFQGTQAMTDVAFVSVKGAYQLLMAIRDHAVAPLVVGGQPVQDPFLELGEAGERHAPPPLPLSLW
jgi:hypothetical protein